MYVCTVTRVIFASSCTWFLQVRVCGKYSFDDIQQSHHSQAAASLIKARNKIIHHRQPTNYSWDRYYLMSEGLLTGGEETFLNIYVCIMMVVSVLLSHGEGEPLFVITKLPISCILHRVASCWWLIKPLSDSAFFKINWWSFMKFMKNWRNFKPGPHLPGCQAPAPDLDPG